MIDPQIVNYINKTIGKSRIIKLVGDVSERNFYRILSGEKSFILMDSRNLKDNLDYLLRVYNIINKINISIPEIFFYDEKNKFIICEDFGDKRFDKIILDPNHTYNLLNIAVQSLIILNKSIDENNNLQRINYNFNLYIYNFNNIFIFNILLKLF